MVSGQNFGGLFGFKIGKGRPGANAADDPAQQHADPATTAAASTTEAASEQQATVNLGETHLSLAGPQVGETSPETTPSAPMKSRRTLFGFFGGKKKSASESVTASAACNNDVKTKNASETDLTPDGVEEANATCNAESATGPGSVRSNSGEADEAEIAHNTRTDHDIDDRGDEKGLCSSLDGGKEGEGENSRGRSSDPTEWLPKCRTLQVAQNEMAHLSIAASELHIESIEVLQVLHDCLDMLELESVFDEAPELPAQKEKLNSNPSTTASFLLTSGKVWPVPQQLGSNVDARAVDAVESDIHTNNANMASQSSLGVYARIKIGDEVVTSSVVYSTGLLEAGYIGGEWDFDSQEFLIDCQAPKIHFSIFLKTDRPRPPGRWQDDDKKWQTDVTDTEQTSVSATGTSGEDGVRGETEGEHISDSENGVTVQRKGASILADDEAPAEGLTEEGVIGDGEGQIVEHPPVSLKGDDTPADGNTSSAPHPSATEESLPAAANEGVRTDSDVLLGTAVISVSKLIPSRWTTPRVDFEGNGSAMMMIRIKLLRALLPMPLDEERRARQMQAKAPPMEPMVVPPLRQRHSTSDPAQQILLRDLKLEIVKKGCVCFVNYPATFAGLSTTSTSGAHRGYQSVLLDSLCILGEQIRRDMLENLAALHMFDSSHAHVAERPFDRVSMERDYLQGYRARMNALCVGRDAELEILRGLCTSQGGTSGQASQHGQPIQHSAILVVGSPGSGKSTLLAMLERQLRTGMSISGAGGRGKQAFPPAVVAVYLGGMISPLKSVRDLMYWLTVRLAEESGEDVSATASCFVMQCVELSAQKDRREKQQAELSYEELNAVWLRYLSTSVASPDSLPMPSTYPAPPKRFPGRKTIVIIDGLDEIQVPNLTWVPVIVPDSVELVLSCSDGSSSAWLSALTQGNRIREERVIRLSPMSIYARKELVAFYLRRGGGSSGSTGKGWAVALGERLTIKHMDTIVSRACHAYPDALHFTCAYVSQVAEASGSERALSSFPHMLPPPDAPDVDAICKAVIDRACVQCGVQAVCDLFSLLAAARDGSLTTPELRHLLHAVPFPGELILKDEVAPPASDGNGRGSVGGQLLSWGKWLLIRNSLYPFLKPCGVEMLHVPCVSLLQRRLSDYAAQRFNPQGVDVEIHARMGYMYRRLCDPEGGCSWRGATQERALMALPHHFRGAAMATTVAYLFLDLGYVSACVVMGQGRNCVGELQMCIHRALVDNSLPQGVVIQLMQMLVWLSRSLLHLSVHKSLVFQSAANEPPGSAPNMLAIRRLHRGMQGSNWLRHLNPRHPPSGHMPARSTESAKTTGHNVAGIAFRSITSHRGKCSRVAISKCGSLWASGGDDGFFKIFSSSAKLEAKLGEANEHGRRPPATALCFSPDCTLLATASGAGGVHLFDTRTGLECASFMVRLVLSPEEVAQKIRKNEQRLAANRANPAGAIPEDVTWGFVVTSLVFSSCGSQLLAGCVDGNCHIFEVATSVCVRRLVRQGPLPSAAVRCCGWSLGNTMAACGADRMIILWRTGPGESSGEGRPSTQQQARGVRCCAELSGHTGNINSVKWAPYSPLLASGADDGVIYIWDGDDFEREEGPQEKQLEQHARPLPRGATARLEGHTAPVLDLAWSLSGRFIFASDFSSAVLVWSYESHSVLYCLSGHSGAVYCVANGPGDNTLLTGASDGSFRVWDLRSVLPAPPPGGDWFASEAKLVSVTKAALGIHGTHAHTRADDAQAHDSPWQQPEDDDGFAFNGPDPLHTGRVTAVNYSPAASFLLSAGSDGRLLFRKAASGRALARPSLATPHADGLFDARFLPAHPFLVTTAAGDGVVAIWDVYPVLKGGAEAPNLVRRLSGHSAAALAAVGNPQKPEILSSSRDHTVRLWDLERGVVVSRLNRAAFSGTEGGGGHTCSLDFSPCGNLALTAGGAREVWIWDLRSCKPERRLIGSSLESVCASFSPAGNLVHRRRALRSHLSQP